MYTTLRRTGECEGGALCGLRSACMSIRQLHRSKQYCPERAQVSQCALCWHQAVAALGVPTVYWFTNKTPIALFKAYYLSCIECDALFRIDKGIAGYLIANENEAESSLEDSAATGDSQANSQTEKGEPANALPLVDNQLEVTTADVHLARDVDVPNVRAESETGADAKAVAPLSVVPLPHTDALGEPTSEADDTQVLALGDAETDGPRALGTPVFIVNESGQSGRGCSDWLARLIVAMATTVVIGPAAYLLGLNHGADSNRASLTRDAEVDMSVSTNHPEGNAESGIAIPAADLRGLPAIQDSRDIPKSDGRLLTVPLPLHYWSRASTVEARRFDQFRARDRWKKDASYIAAAVFRNPRAETVKAELYVLAQAWPLAAASDGDVAVNALSRWLDKQLEPRASNKEVELLEEVSPLRVGDKVGVACAFREEQWSRQFFLLPHRTRLYVFELRVSGAELSLAQPHLWAIINGTVVH